ncbi:glycine-rich cell wall structural protein-like [Nasonia vitripennis]|uniref:Uncharacterized protein n=1 Tax=Nasonia vitripennis TaxID=7425 RepID=A0A7M7H9K7_NASVI|nr:glycine-rich cell wall structural protein-like [Nasonia vitripennis]
MLRYLTLMVFIALWASLASTLPTSVDPVKTITNVELPDKHDAEAEKTDDLETDATFWGGYGGWGRRRYYGGWGGRPYYHGWGGRGYGWGGGYYGGGWGGRYGGWGGYYW